MSSISNYLLLNSSQTPKFCNSTPKKWMTTIPTTKTFDQPDIHQALTHILTKPTQTPSSLHSQLFLSTHLPSYTNWDYPPFLSPATTSSDPFLLLQWSFRRVFLPRLLNLSLPRTSWRSKCAFQIPPPVVLSSQVVPSPERWETDESRKYWRKRLRRPTLGMKVGTLVGICAPNSLLLLMLLWDPLSLRRQRPQA